MKSATALFLLFVFAQSLHGQQTTTVTLDESQKAGEKLYLQRCAVCHSGTAPLFVTYGPPLNMQLVAIRGDDYIHKITMEGSPRMPGFQYTLTEGQVNSIIAFLKTLKDSNWR